MEDKNLEALVRDDNRVAVQVGSGIATISAGQTPKSSPFTLTGGIDVIEIPPRGVEFIVAPSVDLDVSEDPTITHYDTVVATSKEAIPCGQMNKFYIKGAMGGTVKFRFTIV